VSENLGILQLPAKLLVGAIPMKESVLEAVTEHP
jgi:hypothetical protein